jgi:elongation factor Ts
MISIDQIKKIREETAVSISDCKKALEEARGDPQEAKKLLKKWGKDLVDKRSDKETSQGIIESYIHPNKKVGVILELSCETDFVAKSPDFQKLAHELCLQIAAMGDDSPLLEQPWIKDESKTVKDLIDECIIKVGEKITVKKFDQYKI